MEYVAVEGEGDVAITGSVLDSTDCMGVVFPIVEVVSITSLVVDSVDSYLVTVIRIMNVW